MTPESVIDIFRAAVYIAAIMITVMVMPALLVGLLVAIFQAATQINEMSLNFVPKILITFLALAVTGPWLLNLIMNYTTSLINEIPYLIG